MNDQDETTWKGIKRPKPLPPDPNRINTTPPYVPKPRDFCDDPYPEPDRPQIDWSKPIDEQDELNRSIKLPPNEPTEPKDTGQDGGPDPVDEAKHWLQRAYEEDRGQEAEDRLRRESARLRKEHYKRTEWKREPWTYMEPYPWEKRKRVSDLFWEVYGYLFDHGLSRSENNRLYLQKNYPLIGKWPHNLTILETEIIASLYNVTPDAVIKTTKVWRTDGGPILPMGYTTKKALGGKMILSIGYWTPRKRIPWFTKKTHEHWLRSIMFQELDRASEVNVNHSALLFAANEVNRLDLVQPKIPTAKVRTETLLKVLKKAGGVIRGDDPLSERTKAVLKAVKEWEI